VEFRNSGDEEKCGAVPSRLVVHRDDKRLAQSDELSAERGIKEISLILFVLLLSLTTAAKCAPGGIVQYPNHRECRVTQ
jgi:hypothetical protein